MAALTFEEAAQRTEAFLTEEMVRALRAVDCAPQSFGADDPSPALDDVARAAVRFRHVRGAPDCLYLVGAFDDELLMLLQLNVWRLVILYRVPARDGIDSLALQPRLARWQAGAEHAGWSIGWRDTASPLQRNDRYVETYCYAMTERDFLTADMERLYWRNDMVQMTRAFMLECERCGIRLSPRDAGFAL